MLYSRFSQDLGKVLYSRFSRDLRESGVGSRFSRDLRESAVFQILEGSEGKWCISDTFDHVAYIASQKYHQVQKVTRKSDLDGEMVKSTAGVRMS